MEHSMNLLENAFYRVASGRKTIEVRLFDEKRKKIQIGDTIVFSKLPDLNEKIIVEVTGLLQFRTFEELVNSVPISSFGHPTDYDKKRYVNSFYSIYSKEEEKKHGVIGIKIKLVSETP
jgi:ASC-1-like (ASCH) protein